MIDRNIATLIERRLGQMPSVVLLGPRQVGKTTLARDLALRLGNGAQYLDLESPADRAKLTDPEAYLQTHQNRLVILDEIHRAPELFTVLRGQIDLRRQAGREAGHFLILGSAAIDLMRQSSESLAGRAVQIEMQPIQPSEISRDGKTIDLLWERGGFPRSYLASDMETSVIWRQSFIRSYLERDIPQFGFRVPAETLSRFWTMLAHSQGAELNLQRLAHSLDANWHSVNHYLGLLSDLLLVRRLAPWSVNLGKRLIKSPKIYVRDSGLLHSLLGLNSIDQVLSHPVAGTSWEGFVIEALIAVSPPSAKPYFYRTVVGAEIDLVFEFDNGERWAIEIKKSTAPSVGRGFWTAAEDIQASRRILVHKGVETFNIGHGIEAMTLPDAIEAVSAKRLFT